MPTAFSHPEPEMHADTFAMELVHSDGSSIIVDRDTLRIGVSEICEIPIAQGPLLHSVIHSESGIIWIEADGETAELFVNGRRCRRMALREGDLINAAGLEMTLRFRNSLTADEQTSEIKDLTQMSAEELCDRIVEEQAEVDAFESARQQGWQNLMSAIKALQVSDPPASDLPAPEFDEPTEACERLMDQIREMSEMMNGRSLELDESEAELVAATALLHETQDRISVQIEELFEQFSDLPHPVELRASA